MPVGAWYRPTQQIHSHHSNTPGLYDLLWHHVAHHSRMYSLHTHTHTQKNRAEPLCFTVISQHAPIMLHISCQRGGVSGGRGLTDHFSKTTTGVQETSLTNPAFPVVKLAMARSLAVRCCGHHTSAALTGSSQPGGVGLVDIYLHDKRPV